MHAAHDLLVSLHQKSSYCLYYRQFGMEFSWSSQISKAGKAICHQVRPIRSVSWVLPGGARPKSNYKWPFERWQTTSPKPPLKSFRPADLGRCRSYLSCLRRSIGLFASRCYLQSLASSFTSVSLPANDERIRTGVIVLFILMPAPRVVEFRKH